MHERVLIFGAAFLLAAGLQESPPIKGRFETFTEKVAGGPKMKLVAATYFGGTGMEEFIAARTLPDETIVAFGNAWGPEFPGSPIVLGKGVHHGLRAVVTDAKGKTSIPVDNPDIAGIAVLYAPDLRSIRKVFRFDWGVASLSAGAVTPDGKGLILAGRSTDALRNLARKAHRRPEPAAPAPEPGKKPTPRETGPYEYEGVIVSGDIFILRLSLDGTVEWSWIFEGLRRPPGELWVDQAGRVYAEVHGLARISSDGESLSVVATPDRERQARFLAVDPRDGSSYFGGDRNTHTGKEPWRQPFLYKFDANGNRLWKLWEWAPKSLRDGVTPGVQGEVSDSSPRALDIGSGGELIIGGWSDGGNSVFLKQPTDATQKVPDAPLHWDASNMKGANSLAHVMKIDGSTLEASLHSFWTAYFPGNFTDARKRGTPNGARIRQIKILPGGAVAVVGSAASVLVQTPGAFYGYPGDGRGYGGDCVVVFNKDFSNLLFSSYLPGCENASIWPTSKGLLVVSRSRGDDGAKEPTKTIVQEALQGVKEGDTNAHILLLELP